MAIKHTIKERETIVEQALSRKDLSIEQIAKANNVGSTTLSKWIERKRNGEPVVYSQNGRPRGSKKRNLLIKHIYATNNLDSHAKSAYCREQGIFYFQLEHWREEFMSEKDSVYHPTEKQAQDMGELSALRDEVTRLKKELHEKNKALAETTALLILKKKADLIWGDHEVV